MPRALWVLIIGMTINVTGSSFLWPLNAIYVHEHLGKSMSIAGLVLMLNSGASVIGNLVGGALFDKIGGFKSMMLGIITALTSLIALVFFHGWPHYAIFLTIIGFGVGIVFPVSYAYAGTIWPEGGRCAFNALYVAQNIGVAVGSALGGFIASYSFDFIFTANALLYVVFFFIMYFGLKDVQVTTVHKEQKKGTITGVNRGNRASWYALITLCIGYFLCWMSYVQWSTTIAAYTQKLGITLKQYSLLWTVNGALIVFMQPLLSVVLNRWICQLKRQMLAGFTIFVVSFFILLQANSFFDFVLAMVVLTIAEMLVWPAIPTVASNLATEGREGFYQGFVNSTATAGRMVGPVLGGFIVDTAGMRQLFLMLIVFLFISIVTTAMYDRKLKRVTRQEKETATIV
jgi:MFS family permease